MSSQLIKNAKDPEDLDELLDFSNKSYRDYKSKISGLEINFPLLYGYIRNRVVFFCDTLYIDNFPYFKDLGALTSIT